MLPTSFPKYNAFFQNLFPQRMEFNCWGFPDENESISTERVVPLRYYWRPQKWCFFNKVWRKRGSHFWSISRILSSSEWTSSPTPLVLQNRTYLALNLTKTDKTKYYIPTARMPTSQEAFAWRSSLYNWSNQLCYVLFIPFVQIILCGHLWTIMFLVSRWYTSISDGLVCSDVAPIWNCRMVEPWLQSLRHQFNSILSNLIYFCCI